jgi:hypothetical protein
VKSQKRRRKKNSQFNIRSRIIDQLNDNPNSTTSDILKVLCDYLGIGDPIELVDDEDESVFDVGTMRATG